MSGVRENVYNHGIKRLEAKVEHAGKAVEPFSGEPAHTMVGAGEQQKPAEKPPDGKVDALMENIKEFIRNIDVKSL